MENIIFFSLFFLILINSLSIVLTKNPVHSVLFLVLVFICATILLIFIGVEFIAMLFLVIYVGAIIVLFLFVIMMLNIKIIDFNERFISYLPIGFFLGIIFILEIFYLIDVDIFTWFSINKPLDIYYFDFYPISSLDNHYFSFYQNLINIEQLAIVLYGKYIYLFLLNGLILLIAMIGAIVLTLNNKFFSKKQDIYVQVTRRLEKSIRYLRYK